MLPWQVLAGVSMALLQTESAGIQAWIACDTTVLAADTGKVQKHSQRMQHGKLQRTQAQ
jgi:hypothetical protein